MDLPISRSRARSYTNAATATSSIAIPWDLNNVISSAFVRPETLPATTSQSSWTRSHVIRPRLIGSTDRGVIELAGLEAIRSHRVDVTAAPQPLPLDHGTRCVRRCDGDVRIPDRLFRRSDGLDGHSEQGGHLLRKAFATRLFPTVAADPLDGTDRADRLELTLGLPPRAHDPDGGCVRSRQVLRRDAGGRSRPPLSQAVRLDDRRDLAGRTVEEVDPEPNPLARRRVVLESRIPAGRPRCEHHIDGARRGSRTLSRAVCGFPSAQRTESVFDR